MRRYLLATLLSLFIASPALGQGAAWTAAFEATPADGDLVSQGDDRIREFKTTVRENMTAEHDTSTLGGLAGSSRHHLGSARPFFQAAAPATLVHVDAGPAGPSNALDDSRLWIDTDDSQPYFWDDTPTTDIGTNFGGVAMWASLWPRTITTEDDATNANEDLNSLAVAVDVRAPITGLTLAVICPDDGRAYEIVVRADVRYAMATARHMGFWLIEDDGAAVDEDSVLVNTAGGNSSAGTATLSHTNTGCTNGTTYTYTVEFSADHITDADVNPNQANAYFNYNNGVFAAVTSTSRMTATLKPSYTSVVGVSY
jgi:hypothetical protein